jgi:TRAP-type C4-dicarboxylate transport system permease small subunit
MFLRIERLPRAVQRAARMVGALEQGVLAVCLFLIIASVVWGVLTRYVSKVPASWTGEVASIAFCWVGMVGSSWLYAAHPRLFEPGALTNAAWRKFAPLPSFALEMTVLAFVLVYAIRQCIVNIDNPTSTLRLPTSIYYVPIVWFAAASLLRALFRRG